jgi:hypothetical protein
MRSSDWPLWDKGEDEERSKLVEMDKEEENGEVKSGGGLLRLRNLG